MARPSQVKSLRSRLCVATEERHELLDEVRAGEERERVMDSTLVLFEALLISAEDEVIQLRAQLAACQAARTGYTENWTAAAKFNGSAPPAYVPLADRPGSAPGSLRLNRSSRESDQVCPNDGRSHPHHHTSNGEVRLGYAPSDGAW